MTKPTITKQMLIDANIYPSQVRLFDETFGDSVTVTAARAKKVAHLFDWCCAAEKLLDAPAYADYDRALAPVRVEYDRATAPALAECARATSPTHIDAPIDKRTLRAAVDKYYAATAPALEESNRAAAPIFAKAFITMQRRKDTDQ